MRSSAFRSTPALRFTAALVPLVLLLTFAAAPAAAAPNVLLICVDDLKPTLGCYGDKLAKSPNIDRLADRGLRFDRAYTNQAVCAPSRNALMTGSRCTSLGIYNLSVNFRAAVPNAVTLPQFFKQHGYRAEAVGKILHTGHGNHDDQASWSVPTQIEPVVEYLDPDSTGGELTREEAFFENKRLGSIGKLPRGAAWEVVDAADDAYADGRIAQAGVERLRAAKERQQPFFLALGFVKPHLPFTPPKKYWDLYDAAQFAMPEFRADPAGAPRFAGKGGIEVANYAPLPANGRLDDDLTRQMMHGYYASVSYIDAQIGKVLDELDALGLRDDTLIVLWGDHGWHLGDHGYWTKHTNYEQANRIPLLVVAPGVTQPATATDQLAETVDLYPTLAALAGLPTPTGPQPIDGADLTPVLRDPTARVRDHAYAVYERGRNRVGRNIRTDRYRLVEWKRPGADADTAELELYDYQQDPLETENLATHRPEVVKELLEILYTHPEAKPVR